MFLKFDEAPALVDEPAGYEEWRADFDRTAHYVNLAGDTAAAREHDLRPSR